MSPMQQASRVAQQCLRGDRRVRTSGVAEHHDHPSAEVLHGIQDAAHCVLAHEVARHPAAAA